MAELAKLEVHPRQGTGTAAARKLRREGIVPANIFGHKQDAVPVQMPSDSVRPILAKGARVVELSLSGKKEPALVSEVQWDTFGLHLLHVDFMRVDPNERVKLKVPVHLRGTAPGALAGGVVEQPHHELTIECLAIEVPNEILVKIGHLNIGDFVHVSEITELPPGVHIVDAPETVVVHVVKPREEMPLAPTDAAAGEPELIGKKLKEGEEAAPEKK